MCFDWGVSSLICPNIACLQKLPEFNLARNQAMYGVPSPPAALIRKLNINMYPKGILTYLTEPNFAQIIIYFSFEFHVFLRILGRGQPPPPIFVSQTAPEKYCHLMLKFVEYVTHFNFFHIK